MGLRNRLKDLRRGDSERSREGVSAPRAKRVARDARAALAATRAASDQVRQPATPEEREAVEAAGRTASARGPVDAEMMPTSGIEQLHEIAGGKPQKRAPLDEFVVGSSSRGDAGRETFAGLVYGDESDSDPLAVEFDVMGRGGGR